MTKAELILLLEHVADSTPIYVENAGCFCTPFEIEEKLAGDGNPYVVIWSDEES